MYFVRTTGSRRAHILLKKTADIFLHKRGQGHGDAVITDVACLEVYLQLVCVLHSGGRPELRPPLNRAKMTPIIHAVTATTKV